MSQLPSPYEGLVLNDEPGDDDKTGEIEQCGQLVFLRLANNFDQHGAICNRGQP